MALLITLAFRNIRRNLRRSIITLLAISVGLTVMLLGLCLQHGSYNAMIRSGVSQVAGHVVIQKKDYQEQREPLLLLTNSSQIKSDLQKEFPDATITNRAFLGGLLTAPKGPTAASIIAVDSASEKTISDFPQKIIEGEWLDDKPESIVIGSNMAETLGVKLNNKIVFSAQYGKNDIAFHVFRIKGIFHTGSAEADSFIAYANLSMTKNILMQDDVSHQVAVHFEDVEQSIPATEQTRSKLSIPDIDILSWDQALPDIQNMIEMDRVSNAFIHFVLAVIVGMGILNTMLMSVLERTREFGVMISIGMKPKDLSIMILLEGALLGLLGGVLGIILGYLTCYPLVTHGLDLSAQMGDSYDAAGVTISAIIYGAYHWPSIILYGFLAVFFSTICAIYPALKIIYLKPVDAMRHH